MNSSDPPNSPMKIVRMFAVISAGGGGIALMIGLRHTIAYWICVALGCLAFGVMVGFTVAVNLCPPRQERRVLIVWILASLFLATGAGVFASYFAVVQWLAASGGGFIIGVVFCSVLWGLYCEANRRHV